MVIGNTYGLLGAANATSGLPKRQVMSLPTKSVAIGAPGLMDYFEAKRKEEGRK